jgi:hypothetical protein
MPGIAALWPAEPVSVSLNPIGNGTNATVISKMAKLKRTGASRFFAITCQGAALCANRPL